MNPIKKKLSRLKIFVYLNHVRKKALKLIYEFTYWGEQRINVGGGMVLRYGFQTLDNRVGYYKIPAFYVDYEHDLTSEEVFPFFAEQLKEIYCSHTLEHIPQKHWQHIFYEFYRILKDDGKIRIVCPDWDIQKYAPTKYDPNHPENHVTIVTTNMLFSFLSGAGFKNIRVTSALPFETKDRDISVNIEADK